MQGSPDKLAERAAVLERCCEEAGRDFSEIELSLHPQFALARTHDDAEALAARTAASHGEDVEDQRGSWLLGDPVEVADQLRRYIEIGVSHCVIGSGHPFDMGPFELLCEEVLPALG